MAYTKKQLEIRSKILDKIYTNGAISRIDIATKTGITPATTTKVTADLLKEKLITEVESEDTSIHVGRKKIYLKIAPNHSYYIGIELHELFIAFCLTDNLGTILRKKIVKLKKIPNGADFATVLREFVDSCQEFKPCALGFALPGHYNSSKNRIVSNRLAWQNFDLDPAIKQLQLPCYFENNVHCMTLCYRLLSRNVHDENILFLHIARGIFTSYVYDGKIHGIDNFLVGEVGHWIVNPEGELCDCGRRGCLQNYISQGAIIKKARLLYETSSSTYLRQLAKNIDDIDFYTVQKAYELGDEGVINILNSAMKYLAITLNNLVMMADTHQIVLHGALFDSQKLFGLLNHYLDENRFQLTNILQQHLIVKPYNQYDGAVAGAILAMQQSLGLYH